MIRFHIPHDYFVVPYVGTWIEILILIFGYGFDSVVPYVGTWIEISTTSSVASSPVSRSLRGNVDRNA